MSSLFKSDRAFLAEIRLSHGAGQITNQQQSISGKKNPEKCVIAENHTATFRLVVKAATSVVI